MQLIKTTLTDVNYKALNRYFTALENIGYYKIKDVYKLLIAVYIDEILSDKYGIIPSEEDYRSMNNVLYCLFGSSCLFPYKVYLHNVQFNLSYDDFNDKHLRKTEDNSNTQTKNKIRDTEDSLHRKMS